MAADCMAACRCMLTQGWDRKQGRDDRKWDDAPHGVILRLFDSPAMGLSQRLAQFHCRMNATYLKPQ